MKGSRRQPDIRGEGSTADKPTMNEVNSQKKYLAGYVAIVLESG